MTGYTDRGGAQSRSPISRKAERPVGGATDEVEMTFAGDFSQEKYISLRFALLQPWQQIEAT